MRSSHLYNKYVNPENGYIATTDLAKKYQYASHLGDQVPTVKSKNFLEKTTVQHFYMAALIDKPCIGFIYARATGMCIDIDI